MEPPPLPVMCEECPPEINKLEKARREPVMCKECPPEIDKFEEDNPFVCELDQDSIKELIDQTRK